jgi:DNA replication protein DnaC
MDRSEILQMMAALQLSGMRAAYDEIVATGIKRKHSVDQIIAALLKAEIAEKHARSIRYQMGVAKLPLAKELAEFVFKGTPINEQLVRDLGGGNFLSQQRNVVAVGGTGTGKSHIAIALRGAASGWDGRRATSTPWIWSTSSRPRPRRVVAAVSPRS